MENKNPGCLSIIATAVAVLVFFVLLRGDFMSPEAWDARGRYEAAVANADAVRSQTQILAFQTRWQTFVITALIGLVVTVLLGLLIVAAMFIYKQHLAGNQQFACLPKDEDVLLEAPIRQNTPTGN